MGALVCSTMSTMKQVAVLLLCAAVFASASPMVQYHQSRRAGSGSGSGSGSLAPTLAPSLAPTTMAPSAAPTKYPTGAPANTPTYGTAQTSGGSVTSKFCFKRDYL